jgi:hypothetical protein
MSPFKKETKKMKKIESKKVPYTVGKQGQTVIKSRPSIFLRVLKSVLIDVFNYAKKP